MTFPLEAKLAALGRQGRLRELNPLSHRHGCMVEFRGREMLNLTSNDYLGLASHEELQRAFYASGDGDGFLGRFGLGAASSRLLTGDSEPHHQLEEELAAAYGRPAALLFNSGYHANIGILPALTGRHDLILSDKLNHASIHDGMRLAGCESKRYRHCDYEHLEHLLLSYRHRYKNVVIVSESVFSMDGDEADMARLVAIKNNHQCLLYLDEAHAVGLYGSKGLGKAEEAGLVAEIDLLVGTFGKALASVGAYVLCSEPLRTYLLNHSRSLIFTTALPPVTVSWNLHVFRLVQTMAQQRRGLVELADRLRRELRAVGLSTRGTTNIVPVLIGADEKAQQAARAVQESGYLVFPVRPPTVPEGTARFRLSLTADMQWHQLASLPAILRTILGSEGENG